MYPKVVMYPIEAEERGSSTSTAMQLNNFHTEIMEETNPKQNITIIIVRDRHEAGFPPFSLPYERQKYFWGKEGNFSSPRKARGLYLIYEAPEEEFRSSGETITSPSSYSEIWQTGELPTFPWRGIFAPKHRRKILFTKNMTFRTSELPRRKPHIEIDRRTLERIDE